MDADDGSAGMEVSRTGLNVVNRGTVSRVGVAIKNFLRRLGWNVMARPECIGSGVGTVRRAGSGWRTIFFERSGFDGLGAGAVAFDCSDESLGGGADGSQ